MTTSLTVGGEGRDHGTEALDPDVQGLVWDWRRGRWIPGGPGEDGRRVPAVPADMQERSRRILDRFDGTGARF